MSITNSVFTNILFLLVVSCNQMASDKLEMNKGDVHKITLPSRGAMGLQLLFRCERDSVVQVKRLEYQPGDKSKSPPVIVGDSINAVFELRAVGKGETKVTFYETQPWNPDFKELPVKEITVIVN